MAHGIFDELFARTDVLSINVLLAEPSRGLVAALETVRAWMVGALMNVTNKAGLDRRRT